MSGPRLDRRALLAGLGAAVALPGAFSAARAATPVDLRRHYVDTRYGQLHVWQYAPADASAVERPPLVCLHPNPYSGYFFDEFARVMASDRIVLCPDTPGYGSSTRPPAPVSATDYALAVADALLALGYGEGAAGSVDVLGFHTGAVLAAELGIERPSLVNRVMLVGLPFHPDPTEQRDLRTRMTAPKAYMEEAGALGRDWEAYVAWQGDRLSMARLLSLFAEQLRAGAEVWWAYDAVYSWPGAERLAQLRRPTLLLAEGEVLYGPTVAAAAYVPEATLWEHPEISVPAFNHYYRELADLVRRYTDPACKC